MNQFRYITGIVIWCAIIGSLLYAYVSSSSAQRTKATLELGDFFTKSRRQVELQFDRPRPVRTYDPIFIRVGENSATETADSPHTTRFVQIGAIKRVVSPDSTTGTIALTDWARAEFFSNAPQLMTSHRLTMYETPQSMEFVLRTMLPPETREQISLILAKAYADHHQEMLLKLRPILEAGIQEAAVVIHQELLASVARHQPELERLGAKYQQEFVEAKIIPLLNRVIWPIVQQKSEPLMTRIGEKIWSEASVWRFGWAFVYDAMPLPRRDLAKKEFSRFLKDKALPILASHLNDFVMLQQKILSEISRNEQVIHVLQESFLQATRDVELQQVVVAILQDVFVDNQRLQTVIHNYWTSQETRSLLEIADDRFEPAVTQIGELLFGNPQTRVTPEFARVLRANVLMKDHRWFLLEQTEGDTRPMVESMMNVKIGGESTDNPFDYSIPRVNN